MRKYVAGLDFGTNSMRLLLVNLSTGREVIEIVEKYPSGRDGVIVDSKNPHLARQNPADYIVCLTRAGKKLSRKMRFKAIKSEEVVGIGVDTTGSTPIPVDKNLMPLSFRREFRNNKNAMAWLWKDHTSSDEAEEITNLARKIRPQYLSKIGGVYSSEWFFSKILHLARCDRKVFEESASFVELCDFIPALLTGCNNPAKVLRSICAAGHKAMYNEDWGGLPDEDFLEALDPGFKNLRSKLYERAYPAGTKAGTLTKYWAKKLGLAEGTPVSVGAFDAHMGAVGAGIKENVLVKIMGTSTCDIMIFPEDKNLPDIPGLCGIVQDSVVPGFIGLEAGQSAVGDIFYWFLKTFLPEKRKDVFNYYTRLARNVRPGTSGLICLDWHNGNRTVLVDQKLTGLIAGLTLNTRAEEFYRALVEATGFGARVIIERLSEYGVQVDSIIACGGLAEKNSLLMQVYADITGKEFKIAFSKQTCALGAAMFGAVAAGKEKSGFENVQQVQEKICRFKPQTYKPNQSNYLIYDRIYQNYKKLHDMFGIPTYTGNLYNVMKDMLRIQADTIKR
ncbi:MAG: ribulokinase [Candidatus Omnitrophica bacterium]|nr:ribulokinase [Candidatus Omnitrophota bacterium]MCM8828141.1 ribulokinase [Candidatus Omnitrophota bacterium]